ncbi:crossover junction endodeoxyribonuclease RuvC [Candidatus Acetothermia bacterium]|nr:crossover junction endodeoxyribonuclease RuvC [Candidatus Acetothermia bacterium]MCI2426741.1 crossover junction endodeoxyribonuclease RuvC [Candidatus Acetothermia bacterium]MCI2427437.1 crossover junction endodeoxyribonuclease RuvC [Candidatus Acetothermia bacterium]MCI2428508.1 crossover junction endodeoxyribonuclease RuvC [Candidatus Acetothermia bacterium]
MTIKSDLVVLGLDPGLATTGYGIIRAGLSTKRGWEVLAGGVITTDKSMEAAARLRLIYTNISALINEFPLTGAAIEEIFMARNHKTLISTAQTRGVLLLATSNIPTREYTPLQVKKRITGYGTATKYQVQKMVQELLRLPEIPQPDDMADSLALALCYCIEANSPLYRADQQKRYTERTPDLQIWGETLSTKF